MKLPDGDKINLLQIEDKLVTYSLNFNHRDGKHKARLFSTKLGITIENKQILINKLQEIVLKDDVIYTQKSQYGNKFVVDFFMSTKFGTSAVRSVWIIHHSENYPRLVTIYPIRQKE